MAIDPNDPYKFSGLSQYKAGGNLAVVAINIIGF
jgi:hypothetical protein